MYSKNMHQLKFTAEPYLWWRWRYFHCVCDVSTWCRCWWKNSVGCLLTTLLTTKGSRKRLYGRAVIFLLCGSISIHAICYSISPQ